MTSLDIFQYTLSYFVMLCVHVFVVCPCLCTLVQCCCSCISGWI